MSEAETKWIDIRGARTHNLQNVSLRIPRDKLVVITGLSGSGKSSLAFDTIYAEGQRRYVESLSAYARQFLGQMIKPDVDHISGLPPTIAIEQQSGRSNPRSTVATTTEVYDFLRLLFARVGVPHCPKCARPVTQQTIPQMTDAVLQLTEGTRALILAPLVRDRKGEHKERLTRIQSEGFIRVRIDGVVHDVKSAPVPSKSNRHTIEAVVDRLILKPDLRGRLSESIETATRLADGVVIISHQAGGSAADAAWQDILFSDRYACMYCDISLPELEPRIFSFNSPHGACPQCDGLGITKAFDVELIVPDPKASLDKGAIVPWDRGGKSQGRIYEKLILEFCLRFGVSPSTPFESIPARQRKILIEGTTTVDETEFGSHFEGVIPNLQRRSNTTDSNLVKERLSVFQSELTCTACGGARLRPESLGVKIDGRNIDSVVRMNIESASAFLNGLQLSGEHVTVAEPVIQEMGRRLKFMSDVGIGYLTLNRSANTLSGGEAQRIRLATQLGSGLVGVCYVLDEPTIGLHQRDNARLLAGVRHLVDLGNSVLVVEHDVDVIDAADWIVDVGPGAGTHGGRILVNAPAAELLKSQESITAQYLRKDVRIKPRDKRRDVELDNAIEIKGATENNLKSIDVRFPLGVFCCVTGVSGSGKSTLVNQILLRAVKRRLAKSSDRPGQFAKISGVGRVDKIIDIDQSPIGRSSRSNPATYTGVFDSIRDIFAQTREAKVRGYDSGRFSFNTKGGRCEACQGQGVKRIEMHFLPDIFVECAECKGTRYSRQTLEIKFRGLSIADVLAMRVEEAVVFFDSFSAIKNMLEALTSIGLGYIALGQSADTLSGGEAQRIKLAAELGKSTMGHTLYILDEPTTGLHFADIHRLVDALNRLCDLGHSLVIIEHNLDVIRQADWIIDLGPEGGEAGGRIVAEGTPEDIAACADSHTGCYLKKSVR